MKCRFSEQLLPSVSGTLGLHLALRSDSVTSTGCLTDRNHWDHRGTSTSPLKISCGQRHPPAYFRCLVQLLAVRSSESLSQGIAVTSDHQIVCSVSCEGSPQWGPQSAEAWDHGCCTMPKARVTRAWGGTELWQDNSMESLEADRSVYCARSMSTDAPCTADCRHVAGDTKQSRQSTPSRLHASCPADVQ